MPGLDGIETGFRCSIDQLFDDVFIPAVIGADFPDDINWVAPSDQALSNPNLFDSFHSTL